MNDLSAIVLVGGRGTRLYNLTVDKTKPYVSFLGKYRIIDFPLSSLSYSNVKNVSILTQYEPYELMKYIGSGDDWDLNYSNQGISYMTPFEDKNKEFSYQRGTADALLTQIENIKRIDSKYILILSGDQVYEIDFNKVLDEHIKNNSNLTIITKDILDKDEDLTRFGIVEYDIDNRITGFEEKPKNPKTNRISLGMYIFNKDFLLKYLVYANELVDFGSNLIPYIIKNDDKCFSYSYDGIFMDLGTIDSLYKGNMYFLDNENIINARGSKFKVYTKASNTAPLYIDGDVKDSIISQGAVVYGSVIHSIISTNVRIERNAKIIDSIIMPNTRIGENVEIKNAIIDENVVIENGRKLVFDEVTLISK